MHLKTTYKTCALLISIILCNVCYGQSFEDAIPYFKTKEYDKALPILEKLADHGHLEAQVQLSAMYALGLGVTRDINRSMQLLQSAAGQGHSQAQFVLTTHLLNGTNIGMDKNRGFNLLLLSAKNKNPNAQFALCVELSIKENPLFDLVESYAWCAVSAQREHKNQNLAKNILGPAENTIRTRLGNEVFERAKNLAEERIQTY